MATRDDAQDSLIGFNVSLNTMNMGTNLSQQQELALHKKHIQALWRHIERLEKFIKATPDGLQLKADRSEILLLKNGGVIIGGTRIHLKVPKNEQLITSSGTMKS